MRQSKTTRSSAGAKDARQLKANKNRSTAPADMPDLQAEQVLEERLRSRKDSQNGTKVPGKLFNSRIVRKILDLTREGRSLSEISRLSRMSHFPTVRTINRWKREDPEFADDFEQARNDYVDDRAGAVLPLMEKMTDLIDLERVKKLAATMPRVKGLEGTAKVNAIDKQLQREIQAVAVMAGAMNDRAGRTLQVAGARDPRRWGGKSEGDSGAIFFDISLSDDIKTRGLPGSEAGQNALALAAMRPEAREKILASLNPAARAVARKTLADLENKPKALPKLPRDE